MYGKLGAIRVVGENVIVDNESQEAVKCFQIDPDLVMEVFWAINPPALKKQELVIGKGNPRPQGQIVLCQAWLGAPRPSQPGPLEPGPFGGPVRAESPARTLAKPWPQAQATAFQYN